MTAQEKKDNKFWDLYNYYLMAWSCERSAFNCAKNELGYEPMYSE